MKLQRYLPSTILCCSIMAVFSCGENKQDAKQTHFTKVDSLTETYLDLKDSVLQAWNVMINDDNQKNKAMHNLLHELKVSDPENVEEYEMYQKRLNELADLRFTQQTMKELQVVEEYDFASNSLVADLISLAESQTQFAYNTTLQNLVETIRIIDQRVNQHRETYDNIAAQFNRFIEENQSFLEQINEDVAEEKKPLFEMAAEE